MSCPVWELGTEFWPSATVMCSYLPCLLSSPIERIKINTVLKGLIPCSFLHSMNEKRKVMVLQIITNRTKY